MLDRVITGGQTGVDQAAWRAAKSVGLSTGGWMPRGFLTEAGPRPGFSGDFGAKAHHSPEWESRTLANVNEADGTLVIHGGQPGPGTLRTIQAARERGQPVLVLDSERITASDASNQIATWIVEMGVHRLNVAGDRESVAPGLGAKAEATLRAAFLIVLSQGLPWGQPRSDPESAVLPRPP
jgi:predicted Rossmann-fold nucleotide-binding protein